MKTQDFKWASILLRVNREPGLPGLVENAFSSSSRTKVPDFFISLGGSEIMYPEEKTWFRSSRIQLQIPLPMFFVSSRKQLEEKVTNLLEQRSRARQTVDDLSRISSAWESTSGPSLKPILDVFEFFLLHDYRPLLERGWFAPIHEGFVRFTQPGAVGDVLLASSGSTADSEKTGSISASTSSSDPSDSALSMIQDLPAIEAALAGKAGLLCGNSAPRFVEWDHLLKQVYLPEWRTIVRSQIQRLSGMTPISIAQWVKDYDSQGKECAPRHLYNQPPEVGLFAVALAFWFCSQRASSIVSGPGQILQCGLRGVVFRPLVDLTDIFTGELSFHEWTRRCQLAGISDVDLGSLSSDPEEWGQN